MIFGQILQSKRFVRVCAVIAIAPVLSCVGLSSASAVSLGSFTANCAAGGTPNTVLTGSIGDTFDVAVQNAVCDLSTSSGGVVTWTGGSLGGANPVFSNPGFTVTVTLAASGTTTYSAVQAANGRTFTVTVATASSSSPVVAPAAVLPGDVQQQVGMPASGKCTDITDSALNWAGVSAGGWGNSWAQWMNGGKGGPVCNRTLYYSTALSKWVVR